MNLVRRILFYLLVLSALAAAVWAYFHLKNTKQPSLKAVEVIPDSAFCVLGTHNFNELANKLGNQNLIWNELVNIPEFNALKKQVRFFDSIIDESEILKQFFGNHPVQLALYDQPEGPAYLLAFNLKDIAQAGDFAAELGRCIKGFVATEDGYIFQHLGTSDLLKVQRGVVAISNSAALLRNAFSKNNKLAKNKNYLQLSAMNKEDDLLSLYINHDLLNRVKTRSGLNADLFVLNGFSSCNAEIYPDEISLNGFNRPDTASFLNVLASQPAQPADFFQVLPFNTIAFKAFGFEDFNLLHRNLALHDSLHRYWKRINDSALFNAEQEFYDNINSKLIQVGLKQSNVVSSALLVEIRDTAKLNELCRFISDTALLVRNVPLLLLRDSTENIISASFGTMFSVKPKLAFVYGNYFILPENRAAAEYYINALQDNAVLTENDLFMDYAKDNMGLNFNYLYYTSPNRDVRLCRELFGFVKEKDLKYFDKLSDFCVSVANYKNLLQFRANVKYQQVRENKEARGLWTFEADTVIRTKPWAFVNHKTGENELLFQDAHNQLYLVNATGNCLWKKPISEPVRSEIFTVDAFKNNKFQILFSTDNYLHLIDRNGEYVKGFPVKLPARATNSLTLLDYDGTKDYRLFIACEDRQIYNYNINGARNEGFASYKVHEPVRLPVKYVKVGLSDYLVTADTEGEIYIFSRKGDGRIGLTNRLTQGCNDFFVDAGSGLKNTRLIYLDDKNSLLNKITLEDKKETIKLSDDFESARVSFDLVDDDKKTDLLIADHTGVYVYDLAGIRLLGFKEEEADFTRLDYMMDIDRSIFLASDAAKHELLVIDPQRTKVKNRYPATQLPLVLDVFRDGKKYLIVVNNRSLGCLMVN